MKKTGLNEMFVILVLIMTLLQLMIRLINSPYEVDDILDIHNDLT